MKENQLLTQSLEFEARIINKCQIFLEVYLYGRYKI